MSRIATVLGASLIAATAALGVTDPATPTSSSAVVLVSSSSQCKGHGHHKRCWQKGDSHLNDQELRELTEGGAASVAAVAVALVVVALAAAV
jgi:hypothetical protein